MGGGGGKIEASTVQYKLYSQGKERGAFFSRTDTVRNRKRRLAYRLVKGGLLEDVLQRTGNLQMLVLQGQSIGRLKALTCHLAEKERTTVHLSLFSRKLKGGQEL